jgi:hypothetical protein
MISRDTYNSSVCSVSVQHFHYERSQHPATKAISFYVTVKCLVSDDIVSWNVHTEMFHSSYLHNVKPEFLKIKCPTWNDCFLKLNSEALVRKANYTDRATPLVGEVSANFCG